MHRHEPARYLREFDAQGLFAVDTAQIGDTTHKRILAIGDSNTFGWGVPTRNAYPEVLDDLRPDADLLRLINRFLKAGVSVAGSIEATKMGVPQGGPLSPVLANVVLDELDWELDRRGHRFARYADDCNILVKSKRAGERVMASVTRYVSDTLRLTVNPLKSAVDRPMNRKFLGFTVSRNGAKLKVADKALEKLKDRVRKLTRRTRGNTIAKIVAELRESLLGWKAYFGIAEVLSPLRDIDKRVQMM
jgi:hypothetical protein